MFQSTQPVSEFAQSLRDHAESLRATMSGYSSYDEYAHVEASGMDIPVDAWKQWDHLVATSDWDVAEEFFATIEASGLCYHDA